MTYLKVESLDEFLDSLWAREEWRPVPDYEGRYEVSSYGRVRSIPRREILPNGGARRVRGGILKPLRTTDGYPYVYLRRGGHQQTIRLNRLVCTAFHGPPNVLHREAAHLDGDQTNNRAGNLKWASPAENTSHKRLHGTHQIGESHPRAKLTEAAVVEIKGTRGRRQDLATKFGVSISAIDDVRRGKNWRHVKAPDLRIVPCPEGCGCKGRLKA